MSTQAAFDEIRALIKEGDYDTARASLKAMNTPKAKVWLRKLDAMSPPPIMERFGKPAIVGAVVLGIVLLGVVGLVANLLYVQANAGRSQPLPTVISTSVAANTSLPPTLPATWTPTADAALSAANAADDCGLFAWWDDVDRTVVRFLDTTETASATARMSLSPLVVDLRDTQRDFEDLDYPDCVEDIRNSIRNGMNMAVSGYNEFLADGALVGVDLDMATQYFADAYFAMSELSLFTDYRMADTAIFIWGGESPYQMATLMAAPTEGSRWGERATISP